MSSLINLATATLLAVSPILSEPKQVERPENVLYEKVEYLDSNFTAFSYIYSLDGEILFDIAFTDNKSIDFNYTIGLGDLVLYYEMVPNISNVTSMSHETDLSSVVFSDTLNDLVLNYNFDISIDYSASDHVLVYVLPILITQDDSLVVNSKVVESDTLSESDENYYLSLDTILNYNLKNNNLYEMFLKRYVLKTEGPGIIDNTFGIVGNTIQEYVSVVVDLFSQVVALFYAEGKLTILGVLMVFAFGIGVVKFGFNMMKTLLRL